MAALLGGDESEVLKSLAAHGLWAANVNGAGQLVAAGTITALDALAADPPGGARVRKLDVAAAFHTPIMEPAVATLAAAAEPVVPTDARVAFVGNASGEVLDNGAALLADLVAQVARPVRFDLVLQTFARLGVTGVLELAPAGVLTALVKRQLPGVATFALKSPDNLQAAAAFVAEHGVTEVSGVGLVKA
jgi:[acyl-carrier-protein] S-malonyltransferase